MHLIAFALLLMLGSQAASACDTPTSCDKCAKESEHSWNPDNKYVSARLSRFYSLDGLIQAAYKSKDMAGTTRLASEYLELAAAYPCNWNYGNAVHDANRFLGFVALKSGDLDAAAAYLVKAGNSRGSPQLNTFGPEVDLADGLLQLGKIDAVKMYLTDIKKFWRMDHGAVDDWLSAIERGEKPRINRFAGMQPSIWEVVLGYFTLAWPALVAAGCTYWLRARIARRWTFAVIAALCGYALLALTLWASVYLVPTLIGGRGMLFMFYAGVASAFVLPILAAWALSRPFAKNPT